MAYTKTAWVNGGVPAISAANLNNLETQYQEVTYWVKAGTTIRNSNDTEKTTASAAYVKKKEILVNVPMAGIRVYCDVHGQTGVGAGYYTLYKNGSALGSEHGTGLDEYSTFSDDITGLVAGDLLQIYVKAAGGATAAVRNFRLAYEVDAATLSVSNQDP